MYLNYTGPNIFYYVVIFFFLGATEVIFRGNLNLPKPLCNSSFIVALEETFDFFLQKPLPLFFNRLKIGEESGSSIPYFMNSGFSLASPSILKVCLDTVYC